MTRAWTTWGALRVPKTGLLELTTNLSRHVRSKLWLQIVVAMVLGIATGLALAPTGGHVVAPATAETITTWLVLPGQLFLGLIQMIVVPLVVSSIVLGIASSPNRGDLRRMSARLIPYFLFTTCVAVALGVLVVVVLEPGRALDSSNLSFVLPGETLTAPEGGEGSVAGRIVDLIPANPLSAAMEESMLQLVVFSVLVGVALTSITTDMAKPLLDLSRSVQRLSMEIVSWAMHLAPLAVFGLLSRTTMQVGASAIAGIAAYAGTVLLGLLLQVVFYLVVLLVVCRRTPLDFLRKARDVMLMAFSTSSSAAVMPLSLQAAVSKLGVRPQIAQFVVPVGATVNMDGTALYQVVAAVFLTQVFGLELSFGNFVLLTVTTVGASIGSPSTPGVGIVVLATILSTIGVPAAGLSLIIGADRILDMSRTAVNVTGDLTACCVMERMLPPGPSEEPATPTAG